MSNEESAMQTVYKGCQALTSLCGVWAFVKYWYSFRAPESKTHG
jgi:hypothetical protein